MPKGGGGMPPVTCVSVCNSSIVLDLLRVTYQGRQMAEVESLVRPSEGHLVVPA